MKMNAPWEMAAVITFAQTFWVRGNVAVTKAIDCCQIHSPAKVNSVWGKQRLSVFKILLMHSISATNNKASKDHSYSQAVIYS